MSCATGRRGGRRTIAFVATFLDSLGLSGPLHEHGADPLQLDSLVAQAFADPCHKTNAVPVAKEDLRQLYVDVL